MTLERGTVTVTRSSRAHSSNRVSAPIMLRYTRPEVDLTTSVKRALQAAGFRKQINTINLGVLTFTPEPLN